MYSSLLGILNPAGMEYVFSPPHERLPCIVPVENEAISYLTNEALHLTVFYFLKPS